LKKLTLVVQQKETGERLDRFIADAGGISRGLARRAIEAGGVYVETKRCKIASKQVWLGQAVMVVLEEAGQAAPTGPASKLEVVFEDDQVLAVNKPPGTPAQPTLSGDAHALTAMVAEHLSLARQADVGLMHQLDLETSGLTLFGKTGNATASLARAFRDGRVQKQYLAVACGPIEKEVAVDAWLAKDIRKPGLFRPAVSGEGVPARTVIRPLTKAGPLTVVECLPETGRTHQIRVHLLSLGTPILGDSRYGAPATVDLGGTPVSAPRVLLHAAQAIFPHPSNGALTTVKVPIPDDFLAVWGVLAGFLGVEMPTSYLQNQIVRGNTDLA
jgi:23S rRNA pseudouridine1911/1915/1917 synthase